MWMWEQVGDWLAGWGGREVVSHHWWDQQGDWYKPTLLGARAVRPDALCTCLLQHICIHGLCKLNVEFIVLCRCVVHQDDEFGAHSLYVLLVHEYRVLCVVPLPCQLMEPLLGLTA